MGQHVVGELAHGTLATGCPHAPGLLRVVEQSLDGCGHVTWVVGLVDHVPGDLSLIHI